MHNNSNHHHGRTNGCHGAKQNSSRHRKQHLEDQKRSDLLAEILEESSSMTLNGPSNQLSARQAIESHSRLLDLLAELRNLESNLNPTLPVRDEKSWSQFIDWVSGQTESGTNRTNQNQDVMTNGNGEQAKLFDRVGIRKQQQKSSSSCAIDDDSTDEYSLHAKVPIKKGERVFEVNRRMMITTETAIKDSDFYDFIKKDSIASSMQNIVLVLHLLNEYSKREQSKWWPYLSILPNKILPILHMNKEQISTYLMASAHLHAALKMLRSIVRQYSYFYKRLQSTKLPLRHDFTYLYYTWGVSMVCSRQNEIPHSRYCCENDNNKLDDNNERRSYPKSVHALIPVLDMCNHDRHSNQATFEHDTSFLEASTDLMPNQELTINYGCRSSGDFYIHNGFVPEEVPFDMVSLTLALSPKQDPLFEKKVKVLKTLNMPMTFGEFTLRSNDHENRHRRDPHLTMFLIVDFLNGDEIDHMFASPSPVKVADEIYDFVQYGIAGSDEGQVAEIKKRIRARIEEYLSRRASINIALLDRTIEKLKGATELNDDLKLFTTRLLQHERSIYESHVSK